MLTPSGKKLKRREKPGPYASVADAIEGLKSPNLATQFLARERLLAEGAQPAPTLAEVLVDAEPNYRARALWVLDRIGGDARGKVIEQLQSLIRRFGPWLCAFCAQHGDEHGKSYWKWPATPRPKCAVKCCWPCRTRAKTPNGALAQIASTYDGHDRYQLETINIAVGDRKAALLARLEQESSVGRTVSALELLSPERAAVAIAVLD